VQSNVWIVDDGGNEMKLRYRHGQRLLATAIRRQERAGRPVRIFDLKSRQIGTTTQVSTRNLSETMLNRQYVGGDRRAPGRTRRGNFREGEICLRASCRQNCN
jgi:hypothetical protein